MYLFIYSVVYFRMVLFTTGRWQSKTAAIIDEQCFRLPVALFLWLIDQISVYRLSREFSISVCPDSRQLKCARDSRRTQINMS